MANSEPLTDLQKQFKDIVEPHINQITINDEPLQSLSSLRLQEVLMERDIDDILCLKDCYSSDLTLKDKADKVKDILHDILNPDTKPSTIDELIKQLIEKSVVFELKAKKRKELTADFQRSFNGLVTKEDIKDTRDSIQKTKEYKGIKKESKKAGSDRYRTKKKQRTAKKISNAEEALESALKISKKSESYIELTDLDKVAELGTELIKYISEMKAKAEQDRLTAEAKARKEKGKQEIQEAVSVMGE